MTFGQRRVVVGLSVVALAGGIAWQISDPGFEPWLFVVAGLVGLFSVWWPNRTPSYASRRRKGKVTFKG